MNSPPGAIPNSHGNGILARLQQEREKTSSFLNRRLSQRPSALELKLRNILKVDSMDNVSNNPELQKNVDFQTAQKQLKSCLKKRPEKQELAEMNIVKPNEFNIAPSLAAAQQELIHNQLKNQLENKLKFRPDVTELESKRILVWQEHVEVYPTFKKNEYNRKPDEDATFRKLTPQMKVAIREELNTYKRTEMEVHESSQGNTCFH